MGLVKLIDKQLYFGQQLQNVYWFEYIGAPRTQFDLTELLAGFITSYLSVITEVQVDTLSHTSLYVKDMDGLEEQELPLVPNVFGDVTQPGLPSFTSYSFQLARTNTSTRHGRKSYAGCGESDVSGNNAVFGAVTRLNVIALKLGESIIGAGSGDAYVPVIVSNPDTLRTPINPIASGIYRKISTQNTRKA